MLVFFHCDKISKISNLYSGKVSSADSFRGLSAWSLGPIAFSLCHHGESHAEDIVHFTVARKQGEGKDQGFSIPFEHTPPVPRFL